MKETIKGKLVCREFTGLDEFYKYITETPFNNAFKDCNKQSDLTASYYKSFSETESFDEAVKLFKNGWDAGVQKVKVALKGLPTAETTTFIQKTLYDVVGFQASVPRYLQGIPTNMVNVRKTPVKQKVITLNKIVNYLAKYDSQDIIKWGAETIKVIEAIERQGIRVKLNIVISNHSGSECEVVRIPVKRADERLNISKLAFPLAHPSMFRRLGFRYIEVSPTCSSSWCLGYGSSDNEDKVRELFKKLGFKNEVVLPKYLSDADKIVENITTNVK